MPDEANAAEPPPTKKRRWVLKSLAAVVFLWLAGDFAYSKYVSHQAAEWERGVERTGEGVLVGCEAFTLDAPQPEATALLLVHGINASPRHWEKMAPRLAEAGFTCRAMRLPGFCKPLDEYADSTRQDWVAAIQQELASLRESHPRVGVVAHSLGGAATIGALMGDPAAADFAVLLAPATAVSSARSPVLSTRAWHEVGERLLIFTTVMKSPFGIDSHDPANAGYPGRCPFTPRSVVSELFDQMDDNWRGVARFQTPLLMVLTEEDRVIDWREAERFYNEAPSEPKELLLLEDSGHAIPIDYGWEATAEAIIRFAEEKPAPGP